MSLLEKAQNHKSSKSLKYITNEDIELAVAWLNDEINGVQIAAAYGAKSGSALTYRMASALKRAYKEGLLVIKD